MVAAGRHVVGVIVDQELRLATLYLVHWRTVSGTAFFGIIPALPAELLQDLGALFERPLVVVVLRHQAAHVIHGACDDRLDALVYCNGIQCHAAPATDADHAYSLAVHALLHAEAV